MRETMSEIATNYMITRLEEKLMELMGDDYYEFAREIAKEALRKEIEAAADSDFKKFVLENLDDIAREQKKNE